MFLLYFGVLQVLLILSTECYSIKINCSDNKTTTIRVTIPITSDGVIGDIKIVGDVSEVPDAVYAQEEEEEEDGDDDAYAVLPIINEATFEGPVSASGTINIVGNFGPKLPAEPPIYPIYRPPQIYTAYSPALSYPIQDVTEQGEDAVINADTRQLLRNLFLLNAAHQANIPCEIVPILPANAPVNPAVAPADGTVQDEDGEIVAGIIPVSGKFTIFGTGL